MAVSLSPVLAVAALSVPLYPFLGAASQHAAAEVAAAHHHGAVMGLASGLAGLATAVGIALMGLGDTRFGPRCEPCGASG